MILVTGATGFIGRAVIRRLSSAGVLVRAVVRSQQNQPDVAEVRGIGDLADPRDWDAHVAGISTVLHLAARVHVMREYEADTLAAFRRVNVDGTRAVYSAAREAGVRRFVFLSSVKAMGEGSVAPYRESDTPHPVDPYGISKLEAEQVLAEGRAAGGPEFVVLRPPLVYGPGVRGNFRRLLGLAALSGRMPLPLGSIPNKRSLVSLGNLVSAIEAAIEHPAAADKTYLVSDGEDLSTSEMLAGLAGGMGRRARLIPCPLATLRLLAATIGRKEEAARLLGSLVVDSSRLRRELGWMPPESVATGLAATGAWWKHRNESVTDD